MKSDLHELHSSIKFVAIVGRKLAKRLPPYVDLDDLISAGYVGLVEAARKFDCNKNGNFLSFAEPRIRGAMLDDLRYKDSLSRGVRSTLKKILKATDRLKSDLGYDPEQGDVAKHLGITLEELYSKQLSTSGFSIIPVDSSSSYNEYKDQSSSPLEHTVKSEMMSYLAECMDGLPEQQQRVLDLYYFKDLTFEEVGRKMGFTLSRACQIHREAVRTLRNNCPLLRRLWAEI